MSTVAATPYCQPSPAPSPTIDQRQSVRLALPKGGIPVVCQRGSRVLLSKANALGERGAFVFTTIPFPLGSVFSLELGFAPKLRVHAKVRSAVPHVGMGVQFLSLNEESRTRILNWIATAS